MSSFRPLIRGFFFYMDDTRDKIKHMLKVVSVPSFGDSFFITDILAAESRTQMKKVSVPSFGDSFFIAYTFYAFDSKKAREFPSPHSGILFL